MIFEYNTLEDALECYGLADEDAGCDELVDKIVSSIDKTKIEQYRIFKMILSYHEMSIEDLFGLMLYSEHKINPKVIGGYCGYIKSFIDNENKLDELMNDLGVTKNFD